MKKITFIIAFVAMFMLQGCFWGMHGDGRHHDEGHHEEHHDDGHHGGGDHH